MLKKISLIITLITTLTTGVMVSNNSTDDSAHEPALVKAVATVSITSQELGNYSQLINGEDNTYLPVRLVGEKLGYTIEWDDATQTATATNDNSTIKLTQGEFSVAVQKKSYKLPDYTLTENAPTLKEGTLCMTKSDIEKVFDVTVNINKELLSIDIISDATPVSYVTFKTALGETTLDYSYNDEYFRTENDKYSPQLAELSAVLSSAAYSKTGISDMYGDMGFEAEYYNYGEAEKQLCAHSIARKEINDAAVYIVTIRGTSGAEWKSNFDVYQDKDTPSAVHYGFSQAQQNVEKNLDSVLDRYKKDKNRVFLITGHSRGGAVANLIAAHMTKDSSDTVYAYTFATPNVSTEADLTMTNIYNFCSEGDFITKIPFDAANYNDKSDWKYKKNGITICVDASNNQQEDMTLDMEHTFRLVTGATFARINKDIVDGKTEKLCSVIPTRADYYTKEITVGSKKMSLYKLFSTGVAPLLGMESSQEGTTLLSEGMASGDISEVIRFFLFNSYGLARQQEIGSDITNGLGIPHNHSCEAYYAWVKAYNNYNYDK